MDTIEAPARLVDHHCHGVARHALTEARFASYLTESDAPAAPGTTFFDTQLGFAVRRWCPPALGLPAHCPPADYLARRTELGTDETTRRLLRATGITDLLVDTGLAGGLTTPARLATVSGARAHEIVRLETLAEAAADTAGSAQELVTRLASGVHDAAAGAIAFKSVIAYRHGLDFAPEPPTDQEVQQAAGRWLAGRRPGGRLTDPVLLRHLLWTAVATGRPLQLHTGFGDPDLRLHRCDPLLLTDFLRAVRPTGCQVVLLHTYPYHRNAAYLSHAYAHVHTDVGLAVPHVGARAGDVLAETLELAPFGKLMFSSDAYGLPELYITATRLFGRALGRLLTGWVDDGAWTAGDARRVADLIASGNARRVYGLEPAGA